MPGRVDPVRDFSSRLTTQTAFVRWPARSREFLASDPGFQAADTGGRAVPRSGDDTEGLTTISDRPPLIHWRQFERLVAEYLHRQGYAVQLGPGSNDDGVDIRMWPSEPESGGPPLLIVQCKRQRQKVEKVVVKALWADMQAEGAVRGMVATTKAVSPGARDTISARGDAIDSADHLTIAHWLEVMRTPGQGPVLE